MKPQAPHPEPPGAFARAVMVLASGAVVAHGITAVSMPLLSRLYSPEHFGLLAVFAGCLAVLSVAACLRYELAIALPESDEQAQELVVLSLACCVGTSLLLALVVALAPDWFVARLGQPALAPYLWLFPLGLLAAGAFATMQAWSVRRKAFGLLARSRVAQSACGAGTQLAVGATTGHPVGLLLGNVLNAGVGSLVMGRAAWSAWRATPLQRLWPQAKAYRRFPLYSTAEALANSAAIQLPVILIAAQVAPAEAGQLSMAMFAAQAPLSLIGTAISQAYLSRAPESLRQGQLGAFSVAVLGNLVRAGAGPLLAVGILAPLLFPLVFGAQWQRAGHLLSWMTPWFLLQFLAVPLSMALHVCSRQRAALMLQLGGLALRVGLVLLSLHWAAAWTPEVYALSGGVFYLAYLLVILWAVGASGRSALREMLAQARPVAAWVGGAVLAAGAGRLVHA
jgi:O-antigen/teichoic acid export membrane protein